MIKVAPNFPFKRTALAVLIGGMLSANPGVGASRAQALDDAGQRPKNLNLAGPRCGPLHQAYVDSGLYVLYKDLGLPVDTDLFDCYENLRQGVPVVLNVTDNDFLSPPNLNAMDGIHRFNPPASGTVTGIGSTGPAGDFSGFIYTPRVGFSGRDTFQYETGFRNVSETQRTVLVDVFVLPEAKPDSYTVNNAQSNVVFDVVANDQGIGTYGSGNALTISNVFPGGVQGSVAISNNKLLFTPLATASGPQSFVYEVTDNIGQKANATVSVNVQQVPVAQNDGTYTLGCGAQSTANVLANDSFTGSPTVTLTTPPASGNAQVLSDSRILYTPGLNFSGPDSLRYLLRDSVGNASADVRFSVLPSAANDVATAPYQASTSGNVLSNDCGTGLSVVANSTPSRGTVTVQSNGSFTYAAAAGQLGSDSFTYTARDSSGNNTVATVNVTISAPNFVANADSFSAVCGNAISGNVLSNDSFTPPANVIVASNVTSGTLNLASNGIFSYSPPAGFSGTDTFSYRYVNSNAQATVSLLLRPSATNDSGNVPYAGALTGNVLSNDCGSTLAVISNTSPGKGTVTVAANGAFNYQANAGVWGADSFSYTARDSSGNNVTATVNLTIATPTITASNDSFSAVCGGNVTGNVLSNDNYVGAPTVTLLSSTTKGTLNLNANGSFSYAPNAGVSGADSFSYSLSTPAGNASASVSLLVLPTAANLAIAVPYASAANGNAFSQACGTGLTVTAMGTPAKGALSFTNDGRFTYQAQAGKTGTDSFTVTARDANNQNVASTVTVTIGNAPQFNFFYNNQLFDNNAVPPAGTGALQAVFINQQFRAPLVVKITDASGLPISGIDICFTAVPGETGASATLSPTHALTDAQGVAQATAKANGITGSYQVKAELCPIPSPVASAPVSIPKADLRSALVFSLTNAALPEPAIPVPVAPWQSLAWLATLLGYLGLRRVRPKAGVR